MIAVKIFIRFFKKIYFHYRLFGAQERWRKNNKHNYTVIENIFAFDNIKVGKFTYGPITVYRWGTIEEGLTIGSFCSIASGVKFILGGNHDTNTLSTWPFAYFFGDKQIVATTKGPIEVGDDVWIGTDVTILSGIKIGKGSVLAAGSLICKDVEPYSIMGGNPAKLIKKRFPDKIIDTLQQFQFEPLSEQFAVENMDIFTTKLDEDNFTQIRNWQTNEKRENTSE